jgi:hypothetical protein
VADILDPVDVHELRNEVQKKYRDAAEKPGGECLWEGKSRIGIMPLSSRPGGDLQALALRR